MQDFVIKSHYLNELSNEIEKVQARIERKILESGKKPDEKEVGYLTGLKFAVAVAELIDTQVDNGVVGAYRVPKSEMVHTSFGSYKFGSYKAEDLHKVYKAEDLHKVTCDEKEEKKS